MASLSVQETEFANLLRTVVSESAERDSGRDALEQLVTYLKTLNSLAQNAMLGCSDPQAPNAEKYKRLNLSNKRIKAEILDIPGGRQVVEAFGFSVPTAEGDWLMLSPAVTFEHLNACWQEIGRQIIEVDKQLQQSQVSTAPTTAPPADPPASPQSPSYLNFINPAAAAARAAPAVSDVDLEEEQMKRALEMSMESISADTSASSQKRPRASDVTGVDDPELARAIALSLEQGTSANPMALDSPTSTTQPQSEFAKSLAESSSDAELELQKALVASMDSSNDAKPEDDEELQKAIQASLGRQEDMSKVLMMSALEEIHRMEERERDPRQRQRAEGMSAGLRNIGNTCYVNSLLQTYFLLPPLRDAILSVNASEAMTLGTSAEDDGVDEDLKKAIAMSMEAETPADDNTDGSSSKPVDESRKGDAINCLWQLQRVFALLCHSHRRYVDPSDALHSLFKLGGSTLEIGVQEDITEFNDMFLSCIEEGLRACSNSEVDHNLVDDLFFGKMEVHVRAEEADGGMSDQELHTEKFSHIILPIALGDFGKALEDLGKWEKLETFTTGKGHVSTNAEKRLQITELPKVMIFPLQRIQFSRELGAVKLHDPFRFPESVSLVGLLAQPNAYPDDAVEYVLLSVLIHSGARADGGHYLSFVKDGARWLQFNDTEVGEVTLETVLEAGKGSEHSDASASCLVYVRRELITGDSVDTNGSSATLSTVLQELVSEDNRKLEREIAEWDERTKVSMEVEEAAEQAAEPEAAATSAESDQSLS